MTLGNAQVMVVTQVWLICAQELDWGGGGGGGGLGGGGGGVVCWGGGGVHV